MLPWTCSNLMCSQTPLCPCSILILYVWPCGVMYNPDTGILCINVNVNVYIYSLMSVSVQQTSQFTPLVLELSLIWSRFLLGEFSSFSVANAIHNSPIFVPPCTHHCWVDRGSMEWKVCLTLLHMTSSGNGTSDLLTLSLTPYPLVHMLPC